MAEWMNIVGNAGREQVGAPFMQIVDQASMPDAMIADAAEAPPGPPSSLTFTLDEDKNLTATLCVADRCAVAQCDLSDVIDTLADRFRGYHAALHGADTEVRGDGRWTEVGAGPTVLYRGSASTNPYAPGGILSKLYGASGRQQRIRGSGQLVTAAPQAPAPQMSPFGTPPYGSPYGAAPAPYGYDAYGNPLPGPYGTAPSPYGYPPSPYGAPGYGAPAPAPYGYDAYGNPLPGPSPYGAAPSPYGGAPGYDAYGNPLPSPYGAPGGGYDTSGGYGAGYAQQAQGGGAYDPTLDPSSPQYDPVAVAHAEEAGQLPSQSSQAYGNPGAFGYGGAY